MTEISNFLTLFTLPIIPPTSLLLSWLFQYINYQKEQNEAEFPKEQEQGARDKE